MSHIQLIDGKMWDVTAPRGELIDDEVLALALARKPRFGGHFKPSVEHYSVAQHSCLVWYLMDHCEHDAQKLRLPALLHDAHEVYTGLGDMLRPAKDAMPPKVRLYVNLCELLVDEQIADRFGFSQDYFHHPFIKQYDALALSIEAYAIMETPAYDWIPFTRQQIDEIIPRHIYSDWIKPFGIYQSKLAFTSLLRQGKTRRKRP